MAPQLDEHVLDDVLRCGPLAEHPQRGTVHDRSEPVESLSQCVIVARRQAGREQRIRWLHPWTLAWLPATGQRDGTVPLRYRIVQPHLAERGGHSPSSAAGPIVATSPRGNRIISAPCLR